MFKCPCWNNFFSKKNKISQSRIGTDMTGGAPNIKIIEIKKEYFGIGSTFSHASFYYKKSEQPSTLERSKTVRTDISAIMKGSK